MHEFSLKPQKNRHPLRMLGGLFFLCAVSVFGVLFFSPHVTDIFQPRNTLYEKLPSATTLYVPATISDIQKNPAFKQVFPPLPSVDLSSKNPDEAVFFAVVEHGSIKNSVIFFSEEVLTSEEKRFLRKHYRNFYEHRWKQYYLFSQPITQGEKNDLFGTNEERKIFLTSPNDFQKEKVYIANELLKLLDSWDTDIFSSSTNGYSIIEFLPNTLDIPRSEITLQNEQFVFFGTLPLKQVATLYAAHIPDAKKLLQNISQESQNTYNRSLLLPSEVLALHNGLFSLKIAGNEETITELTHFFSEVVANYFPQPIEKKLVDNTISYETVIDPALFPFSLENDVYYLRVPVAADKTASLSADPATISLGKDHTPQATLYVQQRGQNVFFANSLDALKQHQEITEEKERNELIFSHTACRGRGETMLLLNTSALQSDAALLGTYQELLFGVFGRKTLLLVYEQENEPKSYRLCQIELK